MPSRNVSLGIAGGDGGLRLRGAGNPRPATCGGDNREARLFQEGTSCDHDAP